MKFLKLLVFKVIMLSLTAVAWAAPVGVAQLKGTYSFQVPGVSQSYGYYNGNTWVNLNNGSKCPTKVNCWNQTFGTLAVGTISFNGAGTAKFLTFKQYDPSGSKNGGGPVVGVAYPYKVSGFFGTLTVTGTHGGVVSLSLGSFNSAGVASVVQLFINDSSPSSGTAILQ